MSEPNDRNERMQAPPPEIVHARELAFGVPLKVKAALAFVVWRCAEV